MANILAIITPVILTTFVHINFTQLHIKYQLDHYSAIACCVIPTRINTEGMLSSNIIHHLYTSSLTQEKFVKRNVSQVLYALNQYCVF